MHHQAWKLSRWRLRSESPLRLLLLCFRIWAPAAIFDGWVDGLISSCVFTLTEWCLGCESGYLGNLGFTQCFITKSCSSYPCPNFSRMGWDYNHHQALAWAWISVCRTTRSSTSSIPRSLNDCHCSGIWWLTMHCWIAWPDLEKYLRVCPVTEASSATLGRFLMES